MRRRLIPLFVILVAVCLVLAIVARDGGLPSGLTVSTGLSGTASQGVSASVDPALQNCQLPRPQSAAAAVPAFGVVENFRNATVATTPGVKWDRIILSWSGVQPNSPNDWNADQYFSPQFLQEQSGRGVQVMGLIQFTPAWAAANPADGGRAVPKNLSAPANSPDNYFAQFAGRAAAYYKGRIDTWIIWNEPEFKPGDKGAGQSATWYGTDEEYYLLLKRGYQAIKAANPQAKVVFGATSYWVDIGMERQAFFKRILDIAAQDPEAAANGFFFDAVSFNIYRAADDLYRVYFEMKDAMRAKGIDKPIWLTETNAMPFDDPSTPKPNDGQRVAMSVQADYAIQAMALASAAGYERAGWYRVSDGGVWQEQEAWGLLRDDGSQRPVYRAFATATRLFTGASKVTFMPLERADQPFGTPWPQDPKSYYPNWQVYQVVFDHPDGRRVTVLWNGTGSALKARIPRTGSEATLVDKAGNESALKDNSGWYVADLGAATARGPFDPDGYYYIGGPPVIIVEKGVPATTAIKQPLLGDPGSGKPTLSIALDPAAQKFFPGEATDFTLRVQGMEGFCAPVQLSVEGIPEGMKILFAESASPGDRVKVDVKTEAMLEPNLYHLPVVASGGGQTATTELLLEVPAP